MNFSALNHSNSREAQLTKVESLISFVEQSVGGLFPALKMSDPSVEQPSKATPELKSYFEFNRTDSLV